jgi:EmrB/QacA subfamily drug resistance transporter
VSKWSVLVVLGAAQFLMVLDQAVMNVAISQLVEDFDTTVTTIQVVIALYALTMAALMLIGGKLGDIYGRRRLFALALIVFLGGSASCGFASSMLMLILCRGLQGVGAGGITALGMALVADLVPSDRLGRYLGYTGLVFAVTSVLGPWVGGLFVDHLTWRWAFFINAPLVLVCLLALVLQPPQRQRVEHRVDVPGALLLGGGVTCFLLGLTHEGGDASWTTPRSLVLFAASALSIASFAVWERRAAEPLIPPRILSDRAKALATFANLVAGVGFTCGIIYPPIFFQAVAGADASRSGLLLAPFAFTCALSTLVAGQVTDRIGGYKVLPLVGMVFLTVGYALLGTISASTSALEVTLFAMIGGVGVGFVMQTLLFVVQRLTPVADIGVATSTVMVGRVLGSSIGVAILGSAFTAALTSQVEERLPGFPVVEVQGAPGKVAALSVEVRDQLQEAFADGLATAFKVAVPIMVLGIVAVALIPGREVRRRMAEGPDPVVSAAAVSPGP